METKLIVSDPTVMMGKLVIAGTRITLELVLEKMAAGETEDQILEAHTMNTTSRSPSPCSIQPSAPRDKQCN